MILGKVVGTVWGSKQTPALAGRRVVEVRPLTLAGWVPGQSIRADPEEARLADTSMLAVDPLGADVGQLVLVAVGSRSRDIVLACDVPTKHTVVAIVDEARVEA